MERIDYEKQAKDFLEISQITMTTRFIKHDFYFADDREKRDIFRITFKRGTERFSITFGQSLNESTGYGDYKPSAYDVLACMTKHNPGTFDDFCDAFGYDTDSRSAERVYGLVVKEWAKVSAFFTADELDLLWEVQ